MLRGLFRSGAAPRAALCLGIGVCGGVAGSALAQSSQRRACLMQAKPPSAKGIGEISTHVISKLGKDSVNGARVRVYFHPSFTAGVLSPGWELVTDAALSANGGIDDLVPPGTLKLGLYMVEFDFTGVDAAARQIFRRVSDAGDPNNLGSASYQALSPNGFFLAARSPLILKVEDANSMNHLVLSVGDKEMTARPGVRAH
uniref:Uncharacterized protein n=1 Tax=Haptolina brevifila TaxID=156173 RepID=A0A7S2D9H9_9EUKA|mmetsp:Transcript_34770/g.69267  ORF Transcript_34770/g.69267 Transcript_34770/m.69267 type:complete len:200 (+) Transcript_34770:13-612(+)